MSTPPRIETEADRVSAPEAPADAPRTNRWYLSSAPIVSALLHLCVPMAAAMIVGAIYNLINAGFIGSLDNTALLAAVTLGSPILGLVMGVGNVFGVGGGALVSRLLGGAERDPSKAATIKRVASYSLWGSVVAGAAVATGLANLVVVTYFVVWLTRNSEHVSLSPRWFTLAGSVQKPVLGVSVGTLLQSAFLIVTALVLNNLAAAYGEGPLAAMGVAVRIAQVPEFLIMGVTIGVLPLLAYSYGKGDGARFGSALRASAITVGAVAALAATLVLCFRDQVFTLFVADESVLAVGVVVLAAQLIAMIANGFTGLITSLFQATGRALPATIMSAAQGVLFIPVVIAGSIWFGLAGIIWALTVTEVAVLAVGVVLCVALAPALKRGLAEGNAERAEEALEMAAA